MDWMPVMEDSVGAALRNEIDRIAAIHHLIGGPDSAGEAHDEDGRGQRRSQLDGAKPAPGIEHQALPEAALFGGFELLLQTHARRRHQIRRGLLHRELGERGMKLAGCFQFSRAIGAARHVLLQFVTSVVRQLVIDMQQNIFLNPFAFHSFTPAVQADVAAVLRSAWTAGGRRRPSIISSSHIRQRATQFLGGPE